MWLANILMWIFIAIVASFVVAFVIIDLMITGALIIILVTGSAVAGLFVFLYSLIFGEEGDKKGDEQ